MSPLDPTLLSAAYAAAPQPLDRLPYSETFEQLYQRVCKTAPKPPTRAEVWQALVDLRKRGKLPRKVRT